MRWSSTFIRPIAGILALLGQLASQESPAITALKQQVPGLRLEQTAEQTLVMSPVTGQVHPLGQGRPTGGPGEGLPRSAPGRLRPRG